MLSNKKEKSAGHIPKFAWSFLFPHYWGIWFAVFLLILVSLLPIKIRNRLLAKLGRFIGRHVKSARKRAQINLSLCFPEQSETEREKIIDDMFAIILPIILLLVDLVLNKKKGKITWHGFKYIEQADAMNKNVIFMVPHGWAIDLPGILLTQKGYSISGMFHHQNNKLVDWLWNKVRIRFGGQLHSRESGIKPFVKSIRHGYWGFYLPDEDHGAEQSEFVDFFGTYKATLPILGRLMKLCNAEILPLFPAYDLQNNELNIYIGSPMNDLIGQSDKYIAERMNEEIEKFVLHDPKQYAWILRFLKTRKGNEPEPY